MLVAFPATYLLAGWLGRHEEDRPFIPWVILRFGGGARSDVSLLKLRAGS